MFLGSGVDPTVKHFLKCRVTRETWSLPDKNSRFLVSDYRSYILSFLVQSVISLSVYVVEITDMQLVSWQTMEINGLYCTCSMQLYIMLYLLEIIVGFVGPSDRAV